MTSRDYLKIAQVIAGYVQAGGQDENVYAMAETIAGELADVMEAENSHFKRDVFLQACGLSERPQRVSVISPQSVVTFKVAEDRDKQIWTTETVEQVRQLIAESDNNLIRLSRWRAMEVSEFWTRPENIMNVEAYR
jgi:hypothetical protein